MGNLAMAQFTGLSSDTRVDNTTVYNSTIHVYLDMTNQQVGFTIQMRLAEAFQAFSSSVLSSCNIPDTVTSLPIQFETPVYGSNEPTFTEFMAPVVILSITYFMAVGLTSISFIIERKEGLLDSWGDHAGGNVCPCGGTVPGDGCASGICSHIYDPCL